ncbi:MAG: hypothetical protein ACLGIA_10320 [Actinomycetes bacterium]
MSHLGDRVTSLVDGELAPDAAARAHAHLLQCDLCRFAVEAERTARRLLQTAADPAVPAALTAALLTMGGPAGPLPPRPGHVPGTPRPEPLALPRPPRDAAGSRGGSRTLLRPAASPPNRGRQSAGRAGSKTAPFPGGPGRRVRRRLAVAVLGSFSLASVGVLSATVLTGVLADTPSVPTTSQLTVARPGEADGSGESGASTRTRSSSPGATPSTLAPAASPGSDISTGLPGLGTPGPGIAQSTGLLVADVSPAAAGTPAAAGLAAPATAATPGPTASR